MRGSPSWQRPKSRHAGYVCADCSHHHPIGACNRGGPYVCARCLMMGADYGAVDHLVRIRHDPTFVQRFEDLLPQPRQSPAPELAVDTGPLPKLFWKVTPRRAGPRDPENPIKNKAVICGLAPVRGAHGQNEALMKRPFLVRHQVSCQVDLHRRYQLESRSDHPVNPFCQHYLVIRNYNSYHFLRAVRR